MMVARHHTPHQRGMPPQGPGSAIDVLLIEDDVVDEMATLRTLAAEGLPYRTQTARSLAQARSLLAARDFDVILADYQLPDGSSFDLMDDFADQLVIFVTGGWDASTAARALRQGVHDYLIKDADGTYLKLLNYRVETALRQRRLTLALRDSEARLQAILDHAPAAIWARDLEGSLVLSNHRHEAGGAVWSDSLTTGPAPDTPLEYEEAHLHSDGSEHTYLTVRFPIPDGLGRTQAVGAISVDITARKRAQEKISNLAFYDALTDLPNRRMLLDRLQQACTNSARHGSHGAVFFLDLDHFKALNDTLGHDHGDMLLQTVARRLQTCVRGEDTAARIGGDEFIVMTVGLDSDAAAAARQAAVVGEKLLAAVSQPCQLGQHTHRISPSIGVCLFRGRETSIDDLLKRADLAMYQAKAAGRGAVRFFDQVMQATLDNHLTLEAELSHAVPADELRLFFQAQIDSERGALGAEVLLRWQHPQRGLLRPEQFLALAEHSGLIVPIGEWVIDRACAQLGRWAADGASAHLHLSLNISARQFLDAGFFDSVVHALQRHGADPTHLRLELREALVQDQPERVLAHMQALHALGVRFVMDDFGISYSSLSTLRHLPLHEIKIAQSLMPQLMQDTHDAAIVRTIIGIAHSMGLGASAAGVETMQQCDRLRDMGCSVWQGHCFGQPGPLAQFEARLGSAEYAAGTAKRTTARATL
jgi:diguanylate cyclase (GGDEF)-like protein